MNESEIRDIEEYARIINRIRLMLIDIFSKDALSMTPNDIKSFLNGLDFNCVDRILKSNSKLKIIIKPWRTQVFHFFKLLSNGNFNIPQLKSHIASIVAPNFHRIYSESKEIIDIELHDSVKQLRKNNVEFDQFMKNVA